MSSSSSVPESSGLPSEVPLMVPFVPAITRNKVLAVPLPKRKPLPGVNKPRVPPDSRVPSNIRDILTYEFRFHFKRDPNDTDESYQARLTGLEQAMKVTDIIDSGNSRLYMIRYSMSYTNDKGIEVKLSVPYFPQLRGAIVVIPDIDRPTVGLVYTTYFPFTPTCLCGSDLNQFRHDDALVFPPLTYDGKPRQFPITVDNIELSDLLRTTSYTSIQYQITGAVLLTISRIAGECYFRTSRRIDGGAMSWGNKRTFEQLYYEGGGPPLDALFDLSKPYDATSHCFLVFGPNMLVGSQTVTRATTIFVTSFAIDDDNLIRHVESDNVSVGDNAIVSYVKYRSNQTLYDIVDIVDYLPDNFEEIHPPGKLLALGKLSYDRAQELMNQTKPPEYSTVNGIPVMSSPYVSKPCGLHLTHFDNNSDQAATIKLSNNSLLRSTSLSFNQPTLYESMARSIQLNRLIVDNKWDSLLTTSRGQPRSIKSLRELISNFNGETKHDDKIPYYSSIVMLNIFNQTYVVPMVDNATISRIIPSDRELREQADRDGYIKSNRYYQFGLLEMLFKLYSSPESRSNLKTFLALYVSQICYYNLLETLSYSRLTEALGSSTDSILRKLDNRVNLATDILLKMYETNPSFGGNDKWVNKANSHLSYLLRRVESRFRKYNSNFPAVPSSKKSEAKELKNFNLKLSYFRLEATPLLISNPRFVDFILNHKV